jgi:hypothetical protein
LVLAGLAVAVFYKPYPSDHTPEGAYMRIAKQIVEGREAQMFPYLETEAQWASYSIRDARKAALDRAARSYPDDERARLEAQYAPYARAPDGADVFVHYARERLWLARLRKDLSGAAKVEYDGERATLTTARGTRYTFRRRDNGIWGMTMFTAELVAESQRAARDLAEVNRAADDYDRAKR